MSAPWELRIQTLRRVREFKAKARAYFERVKPVRSLFG